MRLKNPVRPKTERYRTIADTRPVKICITMPSVPAVVVPSLLPIVKRKANGTTARIVPVNLAVRWKAKQARVRTVIDPAAKISRVIRPRKIVLNKV